MAPRITDWNGAYANAPYIPGSADFPAQWAAHSYAFRMTHAPAILSYGHTLRERIDMFQPREGTKGLVVYVHGSYWRAFDRDRWSHLAAGPLAHGWAVAIPGYILAPQLRVAEITRAIGRAITIAAGVVPGPIRLCGHSAGGRLVTRQICMTSPLPANILARVENTMSISGIHDLRPLLRTAVNAELRLDPAEAMTESPALLQPRPDARLHAWVGEAERPEYIRQSQLIANIWMGLGAETSQTTSPGRHHFDVIEPMTDPDSDLIGALLA